jgi:hypothetical protein
MSNFTAAFLFTLSGLEASLVETDWSGIWRICFLVLFEV